MKKNRILDCTLRDGGYCNDCNFGLKNEIKIINSLVEAGIDIIECGFYDETITYDVNRTKFNDIKQISKLIPAKRKDKLFVVLADYGKFNPDTLPEYDGTSIDGFRIAFHKKDYVLGIETCKKVIAKGYKVFVQPMVSISYTDSEFIELIKFVNEIKPYAFYIVDSFGMMKENDLIRLFFMVEHNLNEDIFVGFHSHNNMLLAYSNAQALVRMQTNRQLIFDASVYGMGRGAGNLNTELFTEYLNDHNDGDYELRPLLCIIDDILTAFYEKNPWGYSLPNYLSAAHNTHPNYAMYFDEKKKLTVEAMNEIFDMMDDENRVTFDQKYAEKVYKEYMSMGGIHEEHENELKNILNNKNILLIAPGKSCELEKKNIIEFVQNNSDLIKVSINFEYTHIETDYIFVSNLRRYRMLEQEFYKKCIVTSKVPPQNVFLQTSYLELLNTEEFVSENAGLMAIKFFINNGVKKIYLAGFDGFSEKRIENYNDPKMVFGSVDSHIEQINKQCSKVLKLYKNDADIVFLTRQKNIKLNS